MYHLLAMTTYTCGVSRELLGGGMGCVFLSSRHSTGWLMLMLNGALACNRQTDARRLLLCFREPMKELCVLRACTALWMHHVIHTYRAILFALIIFHFFDSVSCINHETASERMQQTSLQHVHRFAPVPRHVTVVIEHRHHRADALKVGH